MDELQEIDTLDFIKEDACHISDIRQNNEVASCLYSTTSRELTSNSAGNTRSHLPCPVCQTVFNQQVDLLSHLEIAHLKLCQFQCCICSLKFGRKNILLLHLKTVHSLEDKRAEDLLSEQLKDLSHIVENSPSVEIKEEGYASSVVDDIRENDRLTQHASKIWPESFQENKTEADADFFEYEPEVIVNDGIDYETDSESKPKRARTRHSNRSKKAKEEPSSETDAALRDDDDFVPCPVCGLERPSKRLNHHLKTNHIVEVGKACKKCNQVFFNKNTHRLHEKKCRAKVIDVSGSLHCEKCGLSLKNKEDLKAHLTNEHGIDASSTIGVPTGDGKGKFGFMCEQCAKSYSRRSDLKTHIKRDHGDKSTWKFFCPECPKKFFSRRDLNIHSRQSHDKGPLRPCPVCEKEYTDQQLKRHLRKSHAAEISQLCTICNAILHSRRSLEVHKSSIHGNLPAIYGCDRCGKHFKEKRSLDLHILHVHEKVRPFICEQCGRGFEGAGRLRTHINVAHLKIEREPKHKCDQCDYKAKASNLLIKHKVNVHGQEKAHRCSECPKSYAVRSQLTEHVRVVHLGIMIKCNHCDREFTNTNTLYRHKRVVHKQVRRYDWVNGQISVARPSRTT